MNHDAAESPPKVFGGMLALALMKEVESTWTPA